MRKKLFIAIFILVCIAVVVWFFGLFPVMRVNGDYTLYQTYGERAGALERFESKSRLASGNGALSDGEKNEIKKIILQHIIMEQIFQEYIVSVGLQGLGLRLTHYALSVDNLSGRHQRLPMHPDRILFERLCFDRYPLSALNYW